MCRQEPDHEIRIGNFIMTVDTDAEQVVEQFGPLMQSIEAFHEIRRSNRQVQKARTKLNQARKAYLDLESKLCQERAKRVNQTIDLFAKDFEDEYNAVCKKLKKSLRDVRDTELQALESK